MTKTLKEWKGWQIPSQIVKALKRLQKSFKTLQKVSSDCKKKPEKAAAGLFWKMTDRDNFDETGEQQHNYKNRSLEAGPS